jgi:hypothetical protein
VAVHIVHLWVVLDYEPVVVGSASDDGQIAARGFMVLGKCARGACWCIMSEGQGAFGQ